MELSNVRKLFPILHRNSNGKPLIYFDNAATSQKPQIVINAIKNYYEHTNANIHRGVHQLSQEATNAYEEAREKIQVHFNAKYKHEIIFTRGTTESINLVANGFSQILQKDDEILISHLEHHSNIIPWQLACERTGAKLRVVPINDIGEIDLFEFDKLLSKKTKIVAISHVSNTLGTINPIKYIIDKAHDFGAAVLIDGAQATAHMKVDVQNLNCDFYCTSAHKMYGPTGIGILYGKEKCLQQLPPYQGGGEMIKEVSFQKTTYADLPYKFEAGTPNISGGIAFGIAIDFINEIGVENITDYEHKLLIYATKQLTSIPNLKIIGTSKSKEAVISFVIENLHPFDIGSILDKLGIAVRTGNHCTQPIMERYNITGTTRISLAFYNTFEEIDVFITALKKTILMLS